MRQLPALLTAVSLFMWIMPLGAFIKPSQEKTVCDGQRAFHMCSMETGKVNTSADSKVSFANASGVEHQPKSQTSGGNDFLLPASAADLLRSQQLFFEFTRNNSYPLVLRSLDQVPKA